MVQFLAIGDWPRGAVAVHWQNQSGRRIVPEVESAIERAWHDAKRRPEIQLFDGPMCRLESWRASKERLDLTLSATSYRIFFGTNLTNPRFAEQFGPDVMANPVGVSPILLSSDNYLMLGRRNATVAYYPNRLHPFAGALEPRDVASDPADVFVAIERELREELNFSPADFIEVRCLGLVQEPALRQPEMIFLTRSRRPRHEIERSVDAKEHGGSIAIAANMNDVNRAIDNAGSLTPVALATLMLFARHQWHRPLDSAALADESQSP